MSLLADTAASDVVRRFAALWRTLEPIGRDPSGGYLRYSWSASDLAGRAWFVDQARGRDLPVEVDRNGNLWAWWGDRGDDGAVVTGSHLDSVPHGGGYDGPLGIASALLAVDLLRERGATPARPVGIAVFTEEEGSRFGIACLGSRLLAGAIAADRARGLTDRDGTTLAAAMAGAGLDPDGIGPDPDRLGRIGAFVELHVEQGRALADLDAPVGLASGIWPHGRWRLTIDGEANHAGTTRMADRRDPMRALARTILAAAEESDRASAHAGIYRVDVEPNATNAIPSRVTAWLDARAPDDPTLEAVVATIRTRIEREADGTPVAMAAESVSPGVTFDSALRDRIGATLGRVPVLPTAAGHDAGVLAAAGVPAAMLFVRNPTGVSHAPAEQASDDDCAAGVRALALTLEDLACR